MNPSGVVMALVGVWIGCQLFGGHALERLKIVAS